MKQGLSAFTGEPRPLNEPITESEVQHAMNRLNNNRASGSDELPGELLKYRSNVIAKPIANIFNRAITDQQTLSQIGQGILILLPKPQGRSKRSGWSGHRRTNNRAGKFYFNFL